MRFLIDAQLPPGLAHRLISLGHSAHHVNEIGLGLASDRSIWQYAQQAGATLVTKDEDFVSLAVHEPTGPQVVWICIGNISNTALWRAIDPIFDEITRALNAGEKVVEVR